MAIEKQINIVVKETGLDTVQKQVDKLDNSLENLGDTNKGVAKSMGESSNAVLENGGAMGLLNDATGGLAMTVKDAVEASVLFTKSQKLASIQQSIYSTVVGTSTGAMKAFRIALVATGVGALVIALGLLIANFDKVKQAVLNVVPGLAKVGTFVSNLVNSVTDFVGITSKASRELESLGSQADKTLSKNKFALEAYGDTYDEFTKRKIEANNKYAEHVKSINEDETLSEKEKLAKLKIFRETANREILKAETDRNKSLADKRKEAQDKIDEENKRLSEKAKADKEKADAEAKKLAEDNAKKKQEDLDALNQFIINRNNAEFEGNLEKNQNQIDSLNAITEIVDGIEQTREDDIEKTKAREETLQNLRVNIRSNTEALIGAIAKKGSAVAKALAITEIVREQIKSGSASISALALANAKAIASSPLTAGQPFVALNTASTITGMALSAVGAGKAIKDILSESKSASNPASGGGSGSSSAPSAPSFNLVQGTGTNQIAQGLSQQGAPIKAYVVGSDVSSVQSRDRNIVSEASLG